MEAHEQYFCRLLAILGRILPEQKAAMETAAQRIADCAAAERMVYTFGTGHGHLLALELFYRAGGLVRVCPILDERLMLHVSASESTDWERRAGLAAELLARYPVRTGDILLCVSNSGRNAAPVEMAEAAKDRGMYVIALTSLAHSRSVSARNASGKRLFEVSDLALDNGGVPGDAIVSIDERMVGPTSTAVGAAILQAIVCRVAEISHARGMGLGFYASSNIDGGDAINARYIEALRDAIPGL